MTIRWGHSRRRSTWCCSTVGSRWVSCGGRAWITSVTRGATCLASEGILFDRQFPADSPEGRLLCDAVVPAGEIDAAIEQAVASLTGSGVVSAAGNRKALRVGEEPLATFQAYMATYAREQAYCH